MSKVISFFNHKGGVGKTTLVHNLAFALSDLGQKVLVIDADPQMNLTASMYGLSTSIDYSTDETSKWSENTKKYISFSEHLDSCIKDEKTSKPKFRCRSARNNKGYVDLISGSINIANIEGDLYQIIKNSNNYTKNVAHKFELAIRDHSDYDFVLIDTPPSASSIINALTIMSSDFFIAPVSPSFFSLQAIDNLSEIFNNWMKLLVEYKTTQAFKGIGFKVKFLGIVVQLAKRFKGGGGSKFTTSTETWIEDVNTSVKRFQEDLAIRTSGTMVVNDKIFQSVFTDSDPFIIEKCCDFTPQLRSIAEKEGIPVIYLTQDICTKHNKQVDITKKDGQYKKSFDSVFESYSKIAKDFLNLKQI